jgi:tetratricopeptide (TPR) repeat protein
MKTTQFIIFLTMFALAACGGVTPIAPNPILTLTIEPQTNTPTSAPILLATPQAINGCEIYVEVQQYEVAILCYKTYIAPEVKSSNDDKTKSYLSIGQIYYRVGDYPMAIENLLAGLKIAEPDSIYQVYLYMWLGWSYKGAGQKKEACDIFRQTLDLAKRTNYGWIEGNSQTQINTYCQ